jgi:DNA-directed RNA polymerase subunit RPC12/RpoP
LNEYLCMDCLAISKADDLNDKKCPRCDSDSLMKTYNASDSVTITDIDLYK